MKVLMINSVCGIRSTGRICTDIAQMLEAEGHEVKIAYGRENVPDQYKKYAVRIGSELQVRLHALSARLFDNSGFGSKKATQKFIEWVKEYDPDVIHLHNLHGYYLNIEVLFNYLKESKKKIIWTLHDCWVFTGHCAYCQMDKCDKWITGCYECKVKHEYPKSYYDNSRRNWIKKRKCFTGLKDITIVTPSKWLKEKIERSFLSAYKVQVINNGIDTSVFKPIVSDIKKQYGISDKKVLLGVAAVWDERKGLNDFIRLSKKLTYEYVIVLIGLTAKQKKYLPNNIIGIERTNNIEELAKWYSAAEMFLNPTYEDNYPTTNLEAIACGTPVLTYNTGGSPESAKWYGKVVKFLDKIEQYLDLTDMVREINTNKLSYTYMTRRYADLYISGEISNIQGRKDC